eukprot:scaffold36_cov191-Ochromonas_danica.AAC.6
MMLGLGHDYSLDMWTLGILMYELLYGRTPFVTPKTISTTSTTASTTTSSGGMMIIDEKQEEALHRQRMYEKILSYRDNLTFPTTISSHQEEGEGEGEEGKDISCEAKDIMRALIRTNAKDRMTVTDLLNQPWMMTNMMAMKTLSQQVADNDDEEEEDQEENPVSITFEMRQL